MTGKFYAQDPFQNAESIKPVFYDDHCDTSDYLVAVVCGAIAGMIDIFLVGSPTDSKLLHWTDAQVDKAVMGFAKIRGWQPRAGQENNVKSAIGFLEKGFKVNYDQRHTGDVGGLFNMSAKNHHMKSLAHSPDIVGLFFSILNQFTSTSSFVSEGQMMIVQTENFELQGGNLPAKIFCGFLNWLGHLMSDIAGSSGAVGRGSGIVIPFYEFFSFMNVGSFCDGKDRNTIAVIATKVFQEGYDFRFGLAMTLPVLVCDLSIRLLWALKRYFLHHKPIEECIPTKYHNDLRMMLLFGNGTLCVMDGADAAIRSGGNAVAFFMRLNLIAWFRFVMLVLREIGIRTGISFPMQKQLDAFIRIRQAVHNYLEDLKKIDIEAFKKESEKWNNFCMEMEKTNTPAELNSILKIQCIEMGCNLPWQGDFDTFVSDRNNRLVFS